MTRSRVLLENEVEGLARAIRARTIMTAHEDLVTVSEEQTLASAREKRPPNIDQLPVIRGDIVVGVLRFAAIVGLDDRLRVRDISSTFTSFTSLPPDAPIVDVLQRLLDNDCVVVADNQQLCGLVHFSDLNRQALRVYFYLWLSSLEMALAEIFAQSHIAEETWIPKLSEDRQVLILGRQAYERQQNIEVDATESLELRDLLNVTSKIPEQLQLLGLRKRELTDHVNELLILRNRSMHPVRLLVRSHDDVARLVAVFDNLRRFVECARRAAIALQAART